MVSSRLLRRLAQSLLAAVLVVAVAAPASAQLPELPVPLPTDGIPEIPDIPGIDLLDPVLDPVEELVGDLVGVVGDVLADIPVLNTLQLLGNDAVDAAIAFSRATYDTAPVALLTRADRFPDALATGGVQGGYDAPLLLTGSDRLDPRTLAELQRLGVVAVAILGSTDAVSEQVVADLAANGIEGHRVGGPTRVETSALGAAIWYPTATTAVVTRAYPAVGADDSQAYADLLAVGPYAAENGWPVLLTQSELLSPAVAEYLAASGISSVVIIGGEGAVSGAAEQAIQGLGIATSRIAGTNRFDTAVKVAEARGYANSAGPQRIILAEGGARSDVWAPGFAAAAHGAEHGAPIILADGLVLPPETLTFILDGVTDNLLDGGPALLCASFVNPATCEATGLLLLGALTDALDLLGLDLPGLIASVPVLGPILIDVLEQLGLDEAVDTVTDIVGDVVTDPEGTVGDVVEDPVGAVDDVVDDLLPGDDVVPALPL